MTAIEIWNMVTGGGAISGFFVLALVCFIWSQRVQELSCTVDKNMDEMSRATDRLTTAVIEMTMTLIAQSPVEQRPALVQSLKTILQDRETVKK